MPGRVLTTPCAEPADARRHFEARPAYYETDCWDVHQSLPERTTDFALLDTRGPAAFAAGHISGAEHLYHADITAERLNAYPEGTVFAVYCAGPYCNAADKAAAKLGALGRPVKLMLGGITGWQDEGFALETTSPQRQRA